MPSIFKTAWDGADGAKTYAVSVLVIVYSVSGALLGAHDWNFAAELIMPALGLSALRHALPSKK